MCVYAHLLMATMFHHSQAAAGKLPGAMAGPDQEVEFDENEIKMDIPLEGVPVGFGGNICPLTHPRVGIALILTAASLEVWIVFE